MKPTVVKRWRKKAEDTSAWAIVLKEKMVKLYGPYAEGQGEEKRKGN
jgi:hypothetical protein